MALAFSVALLGLILEDVNLLTLAVLNDLGGNLGALNNGSADGGGTVTYNCENLINGNLVAGFNIQFLDENDVALTDSVLLTAGFNNCVQHIAPS